MKYLVLSFLLFFNQGFSQDFTITRQPKEYQVVCLGEFSFTLDVLVSGGGDLGHNYIWEYSTTEGGPFTYYMETPSNYMRPPSNIPGTTYYRVVITDVESGSIVISDVCTVIVNQIQEGTALVKHSGIEASGVIELAGFGGQPPYKFTLLEINPIPQDINIFSGLAPRFYTAQIVDELGCYIEFTIDVLEVDIDNTVTIVDNALTTNIEAISYQWINAETESAIEGAIDRTFIAEAIGSYRVEMTFDTDVLDKKINNKNNESLPALITVSSPVYEVATLGLNDSKLPSLNLYPNPAINYLLLPEESLIDKSYIIYDILGHQVESGIILNHTLPVDKLSKGIYFLSVSNYKIFKFLEK